MATRAWVRRHGALGLITLVLLMVLKLGWSEVTDTAEVRDSYCCCCNIVSERKQQGLSCHRESDVYSNLMPVAEVVATSWPQKRHSLDSLPCIVPTDRIVVAMSYNNNHMVHPRDPFRSLYSTPPPSRLLPHVTSWNTDRIEVCPVSELSQVPVMLRMTRRLLIDNKPRSTRWLLPLLTEDTRNKRLKYQLLLVPWYVLRSVSYRR